MLDEAAANARSDMKAVLASWCGMVADERGVTRLICRDVADLVGFLAIHLEWLFAHSAGPDFGDEIAAVTTAARRVCRRDQVMERALGRCVENDCTGIIVAAAPEGASRASLEIRCDAGHVLATGRVAAARTPPW